MLNVKHAIAIPAAALAILAGGSVAVAHADTPDLYSASVAQPTEVIAVDRGKTVKPVTRSYSDMHCYSYNTQRAFTQRATASGYRWVTRFGRTMATWKRSTGSFTGVASVTLCAVWKG